MNITSEQQDNDDNIRMARVAKTLGISVHPTCSECDWIVMLIGRHAPDCPLRKIRAKVVRAIKRQAADDHRKRMAKKGRGFKVFTGGGGPAERQGTLVRKRSTKNRGPKRETRRCRPCAEDRMFVNNRCSICEHERTCNYYPTGRNCQTCYPGK